jgi:hypothetical protein
MGAVRASCTGWPRAAERGILPSPQRRGKGSMGGRKRRGRVEHTDEWERIELLCAWPEQRDYELIRPLVHFGDPVAQWAEETGTSERTLYRRTSAFDLGGMESLFGSQTAKRRRLPPVMRRLIVDLKAEHPVLDLSEISRICYIARSRDAGRYVGDGPPLDGEGMFLTKTTPSVPSSRSGSRAE